MVEMRAVRAASSHPELKRGDRGNSGLWADSDALGQLWDALHRECKVDPSACDLQVRDQVAYLHGSVETLAQKRVIARAAMSVPGLKGIVNNLRVTPLSHNSDHRIATEVRAAMGEAGLSSPIPTIKVVDNVVYLSGLVGSLEARKLAEDASWSVTGVEYVVNDIATTVTPSCARRSEQPEKILRDVQLAVDRSLGPEAGSIDVVVTGGIVHLRGKVSTDRQKFLTEDAVRWVPCVVDVVNELAVTSNPPN